VVLRDDPSVRVPGRMARHFFVAPGSARDVQWWHDTSPGIPWMDYYIFLSGPYKGGRGR